MCVRVRACVHVKGRGTFTVFASELSCLPWQQSREVEARAPPRLCLPLVPAGALGQPPPKSPRGICDLALLTWVSKGQLDNHTITPPPSGQDGSVPPLLIALTAAFIVMQPSEQRESEGTRAAGLVGGSKHRDCNHPQQFVSGLPSAPAPPDVLI